VTKQGISALRHLSSLQEFLFSRSREHSDLVHQIGVCLELLPHLHAVAFIPMPNSLLERDITCALSRIQRPCTLQLRHLLLVTMDNIPEHVSLPEVQVLHVMSMCFLYLQLRHYLPKLRELNWTVSIQDHLLALLGYFQHQLQTLRFGIFRGTLHLDRVLNVCPNLSELCVATSVSVQGTLEMRPDTLSKLQTLHLRLSSDVMPSPGLLLQFLRLAPELRTVNCSSAMLDDQDLKELAELAKEGTCMQHLQQLTLKFRAQNSEQDISRNLLDAALISCSIHCPRLKHLNVSISLSF